MGTQRADETEHLGCGLLREGDDHPLHVEQGDELRQLLGCPEHGQVRELDPALARVGVDEADEIDAVLGVLDELACE